ncbi:Hint domain-containing protein [Acetobacter persici]|uniref:Hedgehog/Intein (Hint) domain-containing protein n=1 Tax=Acetobacter persici TaxID=1076596 RepID=A0A6V8IBE1_9PROT|nr:Hint domain-containing protein [Acetobacter persici]GFE94377.1 hypothetical protein DmAi_24360 [Acetobacter persici]
MATYYTYDSAGNVETTWTVTQPYGSNWSDWNVKITDTSGHVILDQKDINPGLDILGLVQLLGSGYVLTPGSGDFTVLISALSAQTFVSTPGATGNFTIGAGAAEISTYYIGGTSSISGLANLVTGSTINVVGGHATLTGTGGSALVGALNGSTVNIEYGGTLNTGAALASVLEGSTVSFGTGGGTIIINGGGTAISLLSSGSLAATTFQNYDPTKDTIELQNTTQPVDHYSIENGGLFGTSSSEKIIRLYGANNQQIAEYAVSPATGVALNNGNYNVNGDNNPLEITYSNGNTYIGACFLAGSMISTPKGDVAVEDIKLGDEVMTFDWKSGQNSVRPVVWTGKTHVNVRQGVSEDMSGYPIRVLKDAIADGVPYKDMLITAEHGLFFDGKFVPARMLVNGRSIFYDKSITSYDYYHIETEQHSVITADGMLTESYLDTGNRHTFRQEGNVVAFTPSRNLSWDDAAAPLGVNREFVEPLFRQAEARAQAAGLTQKEPAVELTDEVNLHLVTETGAVIRQARQHNGRVMFMIPTDVKTVRIVSNASRPSDVIGPFVDDRRHFGVAVGEITMVEAKRKYSVTAHLIEKELEGWNTLECEDTRWTSGDALLPLGERHPNSAALLAVQIKAAGPYLCTDVTDIRSTKRA